MEPAALTPQMSGATLPSHTGTAILKGPQVVPPEGLILSQMRVAVPPD